MHDLNAMNGPDEAEMLRTFSEYLKTSCHCSFDNSFLLTLSGGIDSTVMAFLFYKAGLDFAVAHCNFHLRGKESEGDQLFVEDLAHEIGADFHVQHFQTRKYAKSEGLSIQMAARKLRYDWFEDLRQDKGFEYIAVGHNRDDVVETVMLNLSRGTGLKGLTGIRSRQAHIIRPLLFASRREILSYANENGIKWRDDSSNKDTKYQRNAIRHKIIPRLEAIYPTFRRNVIQTSAHLNQVEQLLDMTMEDIRKKTCIELPDRWLVDMEKIAEYPAVETVLFELLKDFGCNASMVRSLSNLISGESGKQIITDSHTITRDRQYLIITENLPVQRESCTVGEGTAFLEQPLRLNFKQMEIKSEGFVIPTSRKTAALDLDLIRFPLTLRRWKPGDHFRPLGLSGKKKVSDYLIDQKVPLPDKQHTWVMVSGDQIVWLIDHRIDDRFKIGKQTKRALLIEHLDK